MYMMQTTQYNAIQCTITMQTRQENTNTTQYITHLEGKKHTSQESKTYVKKQTSIQWVIIPFPKKKLSLKGPYPILESQLLQYIILCSVYVYMLILYLVLFNLHSNQYHISIVFLIGFPWVVHLLPKVIPSCLQHRSFQLGGDARQIDLPTETTESGADVGNCFNGGYQCDINVIPYDPCIVSLPTCG